jgi:lysophospholipase L1-like esterase
MSISRFVSGLLAVSLAGSCAGFSQAPDKAGQWVGTWAAAPSFLINSNGLFANDTTIREIVHVSDGGDSVRVVLSNELSTLTQRLLIGGVSVAPTDGNGNINPSEAVNLTFSGKSAAAISPQAELVSDPVDLHLPAGSDLAISIYVPGQKIDTLTYHELAQQNNFMAPGNDISAGSLPGATTVTEWYFLKGVEVQKSADAAAIVCLGDSITDGFRSTISANDRWPNILFDRLQEHADKKKLSVLDLGIGGNRVLQTGVGPDALARFDRDVLGQPAAKYLILLEGINDIGLGHRTKDPLAYPPTAEDVIAGYQQIIARAHAHHIAVFGGTLLPYEGATYYSDAGEKVRQKVNAWIRTSGAFDGVFDFDVVMKDPSNPLALNPAYSSSDHLHPNDAGYKVMGDAVPLDLFKQGWE